MPKFALKYPFFIIMACLVIAVIGVSTVMQMPVDLFPKIDIPVVVVATFYSGMPPSRSRPTLPIRSSASLRSGAASITSNRDRSLA